MGSLTVSPSAPIRQAVETIDRGGRQIALVVDTEGRLLAIVTDGDVRRGLLRGVTLEDPVTTVMRTDFTSVSAAEGMEAARRMMQQRSFHHVPVVDAAGRLVDLAWIDDVTGLTTRGTHVVLMAGGLGSRLRPLTETVPKPMLTVGGRPILELILRNFVDQGFRDFTVSLNYKGEMVSDHFGDGHAFGASIEYVRETQRMGTAGALSLLPNRPENPFIVMNGDLLTSTRFDALMRFHEETGAAVTMCAREFTTQIPYGVVEMDGSNLVRIIEKPTYTQYVNAGIYVLSPKALDYLEPNSPLDMPALFERAIADGKIASVFPIREYWVDIGRVEDLERARAEVGEAFEI